MIKTATANPTPVLIEKTDGVFMGQGGGEGGSWREERHWIEFYDNCDGTFTKKVVIEIIEHTTDEENIHTRKTKELMSEQEYFKRKLTGDLYGT